MSDEHTRQDDHSALATRDARTTYAPAVVEPDYVELADVTGGGAKRQFSLAGLLKYKWTMLGVATLIVVVALPLIWLSFAPAYRAVAIIEVAPVMPRLLHETEDTGIIPLYQQHLSSQAEIISSSEVLNRVLDRDEVQNTQWYRGAPVTLLDYLEPPKPPRDRLSEQLKVTIPRRTQLLYVSLDCPRPGEAKRIVDCVVEEYLRYIKDARFEGDDTLLETLDTMQRDRKFQIKLLEDEIEKLQKDLQTSTPDDLILQRRLALDELQSELRRLDLDLRLARSALEAADKTAQAAGEGQAAPPPPYATDTEWRRLSQRVEEARDELELAKQRLGSENPHLERYRTDLQRARRLLTNRERQLDELFASGALEPPANDANALTPAALRKRVQQMESRRAILADEIDEQSARFAQLFQAAQALEQNQAELRATREELASINNRISELEQKRKTPASIRRIGVATEPTTAVNDKRLKLSIAAIAGAMIAGVGIGFLRLQFSPSVQMLSDVQRHSPEILLGYLPLHRGRRITIDECPISAEHVRTIRTTLLHRIDAEHGAVVQVTSAGPGSGKTTFSLLLARSLAQGGKRVLLVDADIRKPTLTQRLDVPPEPGLMAMLRAGRPDDSAVHQSNTPGLHVIAAGTPQRTLDVELLAHDALDALLSHWRAHYDVILLDSGPLLPIADASILAEHADGSILMVREGHCRQTEISDALGRLMSAGGTLLGTVFVGRGRGKRYEASYYGYGLRSE